MTIIIGVVILILLIISLVPNYQAMKLAKNQGQKSTRYTIMVGIDLVFNCTHTRHVNSKINHII